MANNLIQVKRTSVSGRAANSTTLPNPGELALNMTDGILYSTNGATVFEIGANNTNARITGTLTVNAVSANGGVGTNNQVLTSNGSRAYWKEQIIKDLADVAANGATDTQVLTYNSTLSKWVNQNPPVANVVYTTGYYGSFYDLSDQYATGGSNTATVTKLANTFLSNGLTRTANDELQVAYAGVYQISYSLQFSSSSNKNETVWVWLRKNGTDVPESGTDFGVYPVSGASNGFIVTVTSLIDNANAGDKFQIMWATSANSSVTMVYVANTAFAPEVPSAIVNITPISNIITAPPGTNTDVTFNDSGLANGAAGLTYNKTTNSVSVANNLFVGNTVNAAAFTVDNQFWANSTVVNSTTFQVGSSFTANSTLVNAAALLVRGGATVNNTLTVNAISANGGVGTTGQVLFTDGTKAYWNTAAFGGSVNVNAQYVWTNTHTFQNTVTFGNSTVNSTVNSTFFTGTSNNTSFVGSVSAANVVSNSQLSGNLSNYQTTAGLSANVATLTSNNATHAFGKTEGNLNVNSAVSATNANNSTFAYGKTESNLSVNSAVFANNSTFAYGKTEGNLNVNSAVFANNSTFAYGKTEGNLNVNNSLFANTSTHVNGKTEGNLNVNNALTANYASFINANTGIVSNSSGVFVNAAHIDTLGASSLGGVPAANYVQNTDSRILSGNLNFTGANNFFTTRLVVSTTTVNSGGVYATNFYGNLTGNVAATTISGNLTGNVTGNVAATAITGNLTGNVVATTISGNLTGNVAAVTISGNLTGNVAATTITGNLTGNVSATLVTATTINATANIVVGSAMLINTTAIQVGNSTVRTIINTTAFVGNVVATTVTGNLTGNVVATTISGNLTGNVSATTLSGNLTAITANVTNKLQIGIPGSFDFGSNAVIEIDANGNTYVQTVIQNSNTGNNASADLVVTNDTGNDSVDYVDLGINGSQYNQAGYSIAGAGDAYLYSSNGHLTIGTRSAKEVIFHANGTTASDRKFTINATAVTIANNTALVANGSTGTAGHVLHSSNTGVYWAADDGGITSITSGNGITGGTITTTGTLSVTQGTGVVVNTSGVHVNAAYINTISANSATYLGAAGNFGNASGIYTSGLVNAATVNAATLQTGAGFSANGTQVTAADLLVTGNLIVNGTTVTLNTATLDVKDLNITLAKGTASAAAANGAGITVDGAAATLTYINASNTWLSNINFTVGNTGSNVSVNSTAFIGNVVATAVSGNLTGNVAATTISGNLTGNVAAVTITGNLTGNVVATTVNATTINATANIVVGANVLVNTSVLLIGNSTANVYVNSTAFVGNVVATTVSGNLSGTAANATLLNNKTEGNLNVNSALYANASITNTFTVGTGTYFVSNGNVGIGTASPSQKLHIQPADGGDTRSIQTFFNNTTTYNAATNNTPERVASGLRFGWYSDYWQIGAARGGGTDVGGLVVSKVTTAGGANVTAVVIDPSGNVGIGNTSPAHKLRVTGTTSLAGAVSDITTLAAGNTTITGFVNATSTLAAGNTTITGSLVATRSITITNGGGTYQAGSIYADANWGMLYRSAQTTPVSAQFAWKSSDDATEYMRISPTGNVGIGNTSPAHKLRVTGTSSLAGAVSDITTLATGNTTITGFINATSTLAAGNTTITGFINATSTLAAGNTTITGFSNVSGNGQFSGNVGIGNAPDSTVGLFVVKAHSATATTWGIVSSTSDANAALTAAQTKYGAGSLLYNNSQNKSGDGLTSYNSNYLGYNSTVYNGLGGVDARANLMEGVRGVVHQHSNGASSNSISVARGVYGVVQNYGSGIISTAYGIVGDIQGVNNSITGNITTAFAAYTQIVSNTAMTIGTGYLYYGAHFGATTTTKYGVYLTGEQYNYFSGNVGIGNTAPAFKLRVDGTTSLAGAVSNITTLAAGNTTVTGFVNATSSVNAASLTVGTSTIANTTGVYTGIVNAATHSVGTAFTANATVVNAVSYYSGTLLVANTTVINATHLAGFTLAAPSILGSGTANGASLTYANVSGQVNTATLYVTTSANIASAVQANASGVYTTGTVNALSYTVGTAFTANSTVVNAVSYNVGTRIVANSTVVNATHLEGVAASSYYRSGSTDVALADGGTNASLTASAGAIAFSNTTSLALTAVGTSGHLLTSAGAGTPTWASTLTPNLTLSGNTIFSGSNTTVNAEFRVINSTANVFFVAANGNVGIGNNTPTAPFVVERSANSSTAYTVRNSNTGTGSQVVMQLQSGSASGLNMTVTESGAYYVIAPFGAAGTAGYLDANTHVFRTVAGGEKVRIDVSGNVGIGNTAPAHKLRVTGTTSLAGAVSDITTLATGNVTVTGFANVTSTIQGGSSLAIAGALSGVTTAAMGNTTITGFANVVGSSQITSLGIGTAASGTTGEIRATNNITAYFSDKRLKKDIRVIEDALEKINKISGVTFQSNEEAEKYGYTDKRVQVGVIAQEIEAVLPQVVVPAPFDIDVDEDGNEYSKSGENYKTVQYEKIVPLLIEAIKELKAEIDALKTNKEI